MKLKELLQNEALPRLNEINESIKVIKDTMEKNKGLSEKEQIVSVVTKNDMLWIGNDALELWESRLQLYTEIENGNLDNYKFEGHTKYRNLLDFEIDNLRKIKFRGYCGIELGYCFSINGAEYMYLSDSIKITKVTESVKKRVKDIA